MEVLMDSISAWQQFVALGLEVKIESCEPIRLYFMNNYTHKIIKQIPCWRAEKLNGIRVYIRMDNGQFIERLSKEYRNFQEAVLGTNQGFKLGEQEVSLSFNFPKYKHFEYTTPKTLFTFKD